ncbi:hypothetical protein OLF94_10810, partial [Streptococcus pneumoniae]|nr:hypothetical protein [Streptococcus pneumoniae]
RDGCDPGRTYFAYQCFRQTFSHGSHDHFGAADAVPSHSDSSVVQSFPGLFPHCDAIRLGHLSYVGNPERVVEEDARIDEDGV